MDDPHCQAFVATVMEQLLIAGVQLFVLTHANQLVESIRQTHAHRFPRKLRISDLVKAGPTVEDEESIKTCLELGKAYSGGNEDFRRSSLVAIRRSVEHIVRGVCKSTGSPPPPAGCMAVDMLPYFTPCVGTTPQQHSGLRATIKFANPSTHAAPGWTVPTQPQLIPHLDRLAGLAKKFNLL